VARGTALHGVGLTVGRGELTALMGPSGSGKTALLRAIAGLDRVSRGRVMIGGRDVTALPPEDRGIGFVFDSPHLFDHLTVKGNVGFGLRLPKEVAHARVDEMLALLGLTDVAARSTAELTDAQRRRTAVARALAPAPTLLLLDAARPAFEPATARALARLLLDLQRRLRIATLMVAEEGEEVLTTADRLVILRDGRVEQEAPPVEVYRRPATLFAAGCLGTMNFLPGVVSGINKVRIGKIELRCPSRLPSGTRVTLCLRPEDVNVRGAGGVNTLHVLVRELEFLGPLYRVKLAVHGIDQPVLAFFSANLVRDLGLQAGISVPVALPPEHLRLFPEG